MKRILLLMTLASCGMRHTIEGDVRGDATIRHTIDLSGLTDFFKEQCKIKLSAGEHVPTSQEVDECVADGILNFFDALDAAGA